MFEPRGHDMMSGSILYPPTDPANDAGVLFIETSGCLPMCGHGTIGTVTVAIEQNLIRPQNAGCTDAGSTSRTGSGGVCAGRKKSYVGEDYKYQVVSGRRATDSRVSGPWVC